MSGNNRGTAVLKTGYAFNRAFPLLTRKKTETNFELRNFKKSDETALAAVINETWGLKSSPKNAELALRFGYAYLYYNLAYSSFRVVAEYNGFASGIVCAGRRSEKLPNLGYLAKAISYALPLFFCREFRSQLAAWKKFFKVTAANEANMAKEYKGRLYLLLTNPSCRGIGMGKKMLSSAEEYFILNGMDRFYLHTDTECNFRFYDSVGYKKVFGSVVGSGPNPWEIYLYANR
ncbi:MAG: GNAT family N-acetyltransferase [Treponema sp.]|nr:GNAT family N-acetyltransferase [Treponema sp.]